MIKYFLIITLFFTLSAILYSQEISVSVNINTESLPTEHRDYLNNFKSKVEEYVNKNRWTEYNWTYSKIPVTLNIFFKSVSGLNKYTAQVAISAQREIYESDKISPLLRTMDNTWEFYYDKNQTLYNNPNLFEPLTSFLNYYVYVVLGLYFDSYQSLGGDKFLNNALSIANLGASSANSSGWAKGDNVFSRQEYMSEYLTERYQNFRKLFYEYHFNGLDIQKQNKNAAHGILQKIVKTVEEIRSQVFLKSITLKLFFDSKYLELCDIAINARDKNIFAQLSRLDPSHSLNYDENKKKIQ